MTSRSTKDILTSLMFTATLRKAACLEQWLVNHKNCYPGPRVAFADDNMFTDAACTCGETLELTVIIDVVPRITTKWRVA